MCQVPCKVAQNVRISEVGSFREVEEPWMKQELGWGNTGADGGAVPRGDRASSLPGYP